MCRFQGGFGREVCLSLYLTCFECISMFGWFISTGFKSPRGHTAGRACEGVTREGLTEKRRPTLTMGTKPCILRKSTTHLNPWAIAPALAFPFSIALFSSVSLLPFIYFVFEPLYPLEFSGCFFLFNLSFLFLSILSLPHPIPHLIHLTLLAHLSAHTLIRLEGNSKKSYRNCTSAWRLNNTPLNDQWATAEIMEENKSS